MNTTTFKKLDNELKVLVLRTVAEMITDPDFGLELSARAKARLRRARTSRAQTVSLLAVKKRIA